jgi:uncharacterized protein YegP (UPF0339 family)
MATATKTSGRPSQPASAEITAAGRQGPRAVVFSDNAGCYRWEIVAADGASLARSGSFTSRREAQDAAAAACSEIAPVDQHEGGDA